MSAAQVFINCMGIIPEIIVAAFACLILAWDFLKPEESHELLGAVSLIGLLVALMFTGPLWGQEMTLFSKMIAVDAFAVCFKFICLILSAMIIVVSIPYLKRAKIVRGEYYALILFATLGMMLIADAVNLLVIYLGLELLGIASYILTGFMVDDERSGEAGIKYLMLGSLASSLMVYGMVLLYGMTGHTNIYAIQSFLIQNNIGTDPGIIAALVLLLAGFGFKIGMVPFHMWLPDIYEGAPTPISAFIATCAKAAPIAAMLRVFIFALGPISGYWMQILAVIAALTITGGNLLALRQENLKRMLAFSGISHIGYILMGLVAAAVSREIGLTSVVFYLIVYLLANVGAFGVITYICKEGGRWGENYSDIKGLAKVSPLAAMVMSIFVLSMLGVPPTGGFVGKLWVFAAAIKTNIVWLAVVGIVNAVISAYYYLRVMVMMYMHEPSSELTITPSPTLALALLLMAAVTVYMGLNPNAFYDIAHSSLRLFL